MRLISLVATTAISALIPRMALGECDSAHAIWADNSGPNRVIMYYTEKTPSAQVRFERWSGSQMIWRLTGRIDCSKEVLFCGLEVPLTNGEFVRVPVEEVPGADRAEYMVFAQLMQTVLLAQTYHAERPQLAVQWAAEVPVSREPVRLPNVYQFFACQG